MKFLVVGPSWIGDMVMAQSLFRLLKRRFASCEIDVLAPAWSHPVLARMPEVRQAIALPMGHGELGLGARWRLGRSLASQGYDRAIVLPRSWKSALVPFAARIPHRTGFHGEQRFVLLNDRRRLDKRILNQTVKRFVALGLEQGQVLEPEHVLYPRLQVSQKNQQHLVDTLQLHATLPAVALMPGAEYGPAKQWPLDHYRQLAERLVTQGYQVWVLGSQKDAAAGEAIVASGHPALLNLCGRTQLVDAVDLLAMAEQAVTNDSGLMHVAAAVGIKVHAIYGSSSPEFTPPLTDKAVIHYLGLECSPCFKRVCPLGHMKCLNDIGADHLFDCLKQQAGVG